MSIKGHYYTDNAELERIATWIENKLPELTYYGYNHKQCNKIILAFLLRNYLIELIYQPPFTYGKFEEMVLTLKESILNINAPRNNRP